MSRNSNRATPVDCCSTVLLGQRYLILEFETNATPRRGTMVDAVRVFILCSLFWTPVYHLSVCNRGCISGGGHAERRARSFVFPSTCVPRCVLSMYLRLRVRSSLPSSIFESFLYNHELVTFHASRLHCSPHGVKKNAFLQDLDSIAT